MNQKMTKQEFAVLMAKLRAKYQNGLRDEVLWLASVSEYWVAFGGYDAHVLRGVFSKVWRKHTDWMPSAGHIAEMLEAEAKTHSIADGGTYTPPERQLETDDGDGEPTEQGRAMCKGIIDGLAGGMDIGDEP